MIVFAADMTWTCWTLCIQSIGSILARSFMFSLARLPSVPELRSASHCCMRVKKSSPGRMRADLLNGSLRQGELLTTFYRTSGEMSNSLGDVADRRERNSDVESSADDESDCWTSNEVSQRLQAKARAGTHRLTRRRSSKPSRCPCEPTWR